MAIDKIFKSTNLDDVADNILSEVDDFVFSVDKMQQRKVAGNVQKVVQAFRQIETELQKRYDNVTDVLEKRITSINDGRDGLNGIDGRSGRDGKPGRDGVNGKQGPPGTPGKDGIDGVNGVSVTNANIDFDGSLVISLSTGEQINVGEVVPPELERQLVELRQGGSAGSSGDVMGPTSSTDNAIARFDGTTGKLVQNSVVTIADTTGNMTGVGTFNATGLATLTAGAVVQGLTVGRGAGAVSTNTAVGDSALVSNLSGSQDTALGTGALVSNTTGSNNVGAGYQAGYLNQSGNQNTYLGSQAGFSGVGSFNTAIGYQAGYTSTVNNNTFIGYYCGQLTTGTKNTFIGVNGSGYLVTTGEKNTIIGGYQGDTAPISATGSNFVVLSDGEGNIVASTKTANTFALQSGTLSSGTGIAFPATQSASSDANTLDDYEEGTWIPTQGAGLTVVGAFTSSGTYTKIGRLVSVYGTVLGATSVATTAGTIMFQSLPFSAAEISPVGAMNNDNRNVFGGFSVFGTTAYSATTIPATTRIDFSITYSV